MDPVAELANLKSELATLEAKITRLEKQLASATKDKEKVIITQLSEIRAEKKQVRELWMKMFDHVARSAEEPVDSRSQQKDLPAQAMTPRDMKYAFLKLNHIRGTCVKNRIQSLAMSKGLGGYVERTGHDTFIILAVAPVTNSEALRDFVLTIVEIFGRLNVVEQPSDGPSKKNEKLVKIFHNGFKKASNKNHEGGSSMELTPDDASDMVSVRVTSELWK